MIDSQPAATTPADDAVRIRGCELHVRQRALWRDGEPVALTPREMDLLLALARNAHRWASAEMLLRAVWGAGEATPNNLRVHLSHLRRQIGADAIEHRTGFGWRLRVDGVAHPIAHAAVDDHGAASPA